MSPGPPWWAAIERENWPEGLEEDIRPLWHEEHGDRGIELVCIGQELDHLAAKAELERGLLLACLLLSWVPLRVPLLPRPLSHGDPALTPSGAY